MLCVSEWGNGHGTLLTMQRTHCFDWRRTSNSGIRLDLSRLIWPTLCMFPVLTSKWEGRPFYQWESVGRDKDTFPTWAQVASFCHFWDYILISMASGRGTWVSSTSFILLNKIMASLSVLLLWGLCQTWSTRLHYSPFVIASEQR